MTTARAVRIAGRRNELLADAARRRCSRSSRVTTRDMPAPSDGPCDATSFRCTIEKGKFADVIAVSGNPLSDVTEMERVKFVMKGGMVVKNELAQAAAPCAP